MSCLSKDTSQLRTAVRNADGSVIAAPTNDHIMSYYLYHNIKRAGLAVEFPPEIPYAIWNEKQAQSWLLGSSFCKP